MARYCGWCELSDLRRQPQAVEAHSDQAPAPQPTKRQHAMNRSPSLHSRPSPQTRSSSFAPSLRRRTTASSQLSVVDGDPEAAQAQATTEHVIQEELAEIKRYEDFTTIDWVQDAAREALRRRAKRKERRGFWEREGRIGWRRKIAEAYDAGQAWIVVTLVGAAIGLNAAFLNIVTEWLSDIKLGYCETAFYLNENFCCWGAESGMFAASKGESSS